MSLKGRGEGCSSSLWWRYGPSIFHEGNWSSGARKQIRDSSIEAGAVTEERQQFHVRYTLISKQTAPLAVKNFNRKDRADSFSMS